jgi:hypothetical protein
LTSGSTVTWICPIKTPARSVPTTLPSVNEPMRIRPITNPTARVRKTASSGLSRIELMR